MWSPSLYVPVKLELHLFPTMSLIFILTITFVSSPFVSATDERYQNCSAKFDCGNITNISYPFWRSDRPDYCGHPKFWLNCTDEAALITIQNLTYQVLEIDSDTHNLKIAREDYIGDICPDLLINTTLDSFFNYASDVQNITLCYGCPMLSIPFPGVIGFSNQFTCTLNNTEQRGFYVTREVDLGNFNSTIIGLLNLCENRVIVPATQSAIAPVERSPTEGNLVTALEQGFGLQWDVNNAVCETCNLSNGTCGYNTTTSSFVCYCADQPEQFSCRGSTANQPESSGASS